MLLGSMRDLFLQELESLLIDMDGDDLAGSPETQVLYCLPSCMRDHSRLSHRHSYTSILEVPE